jgi:pimeloyl-ACP methyl ester carboxylesterase
VALDDGRALGYGLYGAESGPVVVVLDGPGSRGLGRAASLAAGPLGLMLLVPDRPGFAESSPAPDRAIPDVAADVLAVLDALGIERFGILAQSGGTPYALALAAAGANRVTGLAFTGPITPLGEPEALDDVSGPMRTLFQIARRAPWLLRPLLRSLSRKTAKDPAAAARKYARDLPKADLAVLDDPRMWAIHEASSAEAVADPDAFAAEVRKLVRPWDVDLDAITAPAALWAGDADPVHPPVMSHRLAARLRGARVTVVPGAAAFGLAPVYPDALMHAAGMPRSRIAA